MLTTITIFIIALHMAVIFPEGLTTETKLWSLGGFALLALVSLISAFMQEVKGRDMTLLRNMLLIKAIGFMVTFSYAFLEEDTTAMVTAIRSQILTAAMSIALFFVLNHLKFLLMKGDLHVLHEPKNQTVLLLTHRICTYYCRLRRLLLQACR